MAVWVRLILGCLLTVIPIVYLSPNFDWFSTIAKAEVFFSSTFLSFLASFLSFLIACKLELQQDFTTYLRGIRFGLDEDVLYTIAFFPSIWTVALYLFATSTSFSFLTSAVWFLFVRFVLMERYDNFGFKKLCFGLIFAVAYFMICQKVYDRIYLSTTSEIELKSSPCPIGSKYAPTPGHIPTFNGCGTDGMKLDKEYLAYEDQEECCNQHDLCYDTCHVQDKLNQTLCDLQFKKCLHKICDNKRWWLTYLVCPLTYWFHTDFWNKNCDESIRFAQDQVCHIVADVLYNGVHIFGFMAYNSAQEKACTCIPSDGISKLIKPKTTEIDSQQSKSIFQIIYDNFSDIFSKFVDLLISSPIIQSVSFIVEPAINFFRGMCESFFGVTPLKAEAGWMDILSFLKQCIGNAYETFVAIKGLIEGN